MQRTIKESKIDTFLLLLKNEFPHLNWVSEYKFHPQRRWRFDYCEPNIKIAIEQEGGLWLYGRHNNPQTMIKDMEKYNQSAIMGYTLLRYTPQNITKAIEDIKEILKLKGIA